MLYILLNFIIIFSSTFFYFNFIDPHAPQVKLNVANQLALLEDAVYNLSCLVTGSPIPVIKWKKNDEISTVCQYQSECNLKITATVDQSYNVSYMCFAYNELGSSQKRVDLNILGKCYSEFCFICMYNIYIIFKYFCRYNSSV